MTGCYWMSGRSRQGPPRRAWHPSLSNLDFILEEVGDRARILVTRIDEFVMKQRQLRKVTKEEGSQR